MIILRIIASVAYLDKGGALGALAPPSNQGITWVPAYKHTIYGAFEQRTGQVGGVCL